MKSPRAHERAPRRRARAIRLTVVLVVLGATVWGVRRLLNDVRVAAVLMRAGGGTDWLARAFVQDVVRSDVSIPFEGDTLRARIYRPAHGQTPRGIVLAHGVQFAGMDGGRLVPFASALASGGFVVLTPDLRELSDFRAGAESIARLQATVRWLAARRDVRPGGIGVIGASFAGGLALLAAADASIRPSIAWVISVGGHNDLVRVARFLAAGRIEDRATEAALGPGAPIRADEYGLGVFLHAYAEHFVPAESATAFRHAVSLWLRERPSEAREAIQRLDGEARQLADALVRNDRRVLGERIRSALVTLSPQLEALSPTGRLRALRGLPVLLVHGRADGVIPPSETLANMREINDPWNTRAIVSTALSHVTIDRRAPWLEQWRLVRAAARMLER